MARYPVSEWGCVIDGGQDSRKELFDLIIEGLEKRNPPGTERKFETLTTKGLWFVPLWRKKREFLTITMDGLKDYSIDTCADPYGNTLAVHVGLCTTQKPQEWDKKKPSWEDQTILSDWSTVAFRCVQEACREVMGKLQQDPKALKTDIKGILSVW